MSQKQATVALSKPKRQLTRSPNYPFINLGAAVAKLPALFKEMKRHAVGVEVAVKCMGLSYTSSSGKLTLAAMRSFGLFDNERGEGDARVKLSTRALDIVADYQQGSEGWWRAVRDAAMQPAVHASLWQMYGPELPSDDELRRRLVRELKFNDNAVGPFIAEYKATIAFAKLDSGDKIESENGGNTNDDDGDDDMESTLDPPKTVDRQKTLPPIPAGLKDFPLYTASQKGALYVPAQMTKDEFDLVKKQIDSYLEVIQMTSVKPDSE
jgi:hypothetical protein